MRSTKTYNVFKSLIDKSPTESLDSIQADVICKANDYLMKNGYLYFPYKIQINNASKMLADFMATLTAKTGGE